MHSRTLYGIYFIRRSHNTRKWIATSETNTHTHTHLCNATVTNNHFQRWILCRTKIIFVRSFAIDINNSHTHTHTHRNTSRVCLCWPIKCELHRHNSFWLLPVPNSKQHTPITQFGCWQCYSANANEERKWRRRKSGVCTICLLSP